MSKQLNFFATATDSAALHNYLHDTIPALIVIHKSTILQRSYELTPIANTAHLDEFGEVFLVLSCLVQAVRYFDDPNTVTNPPVDVKNSPVIEYTPSKLNERKDTLKVGRIYWAFGGQLESSLNRQIRGVFNWVRTNSEAVSRDGHLRIFPNAKAVPLLESWVTPPIPNPFYESR